MNKTRPNKNTWYNWLINYIPEHIRKIVGRFKDKTVSLSKRKTRLSKRKARKQTVCSKVKNVSKPKTQKIRNLFILKK